MNRTDRETCLRRSSFAINTHSKPLDTGTEGTRDDGVQLYTHAHAFVNSKYLVSSCLCEKIKGAAYVRGIRLALRYTYNEQARKFLKFWRAYHLVQQYIQPVYEEG